MKCCQKKVYNTEQPTIIMKWISFSFYLYKKRKNMQTETLCKDCKTVAKKSGFTLVSNFFICWINKIKEKYSSYEWIRVFLDSIYKKIEWMNSVQLFTISLHSFTNCIWCLLLSALLLFLYLLILMFKFDYHKIMTVS